MRGCSRTAAALSIALLAGCASLRSPGPAEMRPADLLSGRILVRVEPTEVGDTVRSSSAAFELIGNAEAGELRLSSPLGTVLAVARWQGDRAVLEARGETRHFDDLGALAREMLGEEIPVAALFDWLRGRPWEGAGATAWPQGRGFEQLGWRVSLERAAEGVVVATRADPLPVVTVRARIDR